MSYSRNSGEARVLTMEALRRFAVRRQNYYYQQLADGVSFEQLFLEAKEVSEFALFKEVIEQRHPQFKDLLDKYLLL